jgi:prephenate dehydratase
MIKRLSIGIQGGRGSFNEQALKTYLEKQGQPTGEIEIAYLYTTDVVLRELRAGRIERGQFALENSLGGPVQETLRAQAQYSFDEHYEIVARYTLQIVHCLLLHPEARLEEVETIMTHPQVFAQCRNTIERRYPWIARVEGEGDFVDPARVGEAIAAGALPRSVATISNRLIAEAQGLKVVAQDLQDRPDNFTTFALVKLRQ